MKIKFLCTALVIILTCNENYTPKPLGFFRIDLSEKDYKIFESNCSYQFLTPVDIEIVEGKTTVGIHLTIQNIMRVFI